ncbi:Cysteine-rich receptor-like protein kinase 2 [Acorus gramineus]|uniref:Cysteine-rich receptor-like protein kinase 2 n=1 Tax=Acorus gramineus TaxID=55184 RepID=A0AAV9BYS5_ACOGR|nr:Cysteine-rich receptor-like protein kinase 2 [Acorus gramineus]
MHVETQPIIIIMPSLLFFLLLQSPPSTLSDGPESQLVLLYCGTHHYHNATRAVTSFAANMESISTKVHSTGFAVSSTGSGPDSSHCLAQCYDYLSPVECVLCFSKLRTLGPLCFPSINGRIFLDGCFDRVDNYAFFGEALGPDDRAWCGNRTRWGPSFEKAVTRAVADAVHEAQVGAGHGRGAVEGGSGGDGGSRGGSAYAWASCWRTVDPGGCSRCLRNASASATGCLPWSEARVTNTGCFLRYSDTDFMRNNAINGGHRPKGNARLKVGAIISSVVIMGLCLAIALFFVFKCNREIEEKRKGLNKTLKMIESALVKSSLNFKYSTLVAATGSFDPANKLGEGGYGAVYKAWKHYQIGSMENIIDSNMTSNNCANSMRRQVLRTAQIAFLCTQENALLRPSMSRVLQMLMRGDEELPKPTNPPFIDEDMMELNLCLVDSNGLLCNSSSSSVATMSYSSFCPR